MRLMLKKELLKLLPKKFLSLLFDNNLSFKLPQLLHKISPGSFHVIDIGMQNMPDIEIWNYTKEKNLTIVTKDKDFYHLSSTFGSPPKLIWLLLGNCKIDDTVKVLNQNQKAIHHFIKGKKDLLILGKNS